MSACSTAPDRIPERMGERETNRRRRPAIHQLSVSAAYGDAIGAEIFTIRDALRSAGYESDVFVELVGSHAARNAPGR